MTKKSKGILCIICAAFSFALMNLFIKLSGDIPTLQKSFFRNAVALLISFILIRKENISFKSGNGNWSLILARSVFGTMALIFNFYAIDHLNISDASMLNKLSPFFAILFSYFILKEKAKPYQLACVFAALAGTLFILKPGGENLISIPALLGMLSGMGAGLAYTFVRKATGRGVPGKLIVFTFSLFSCIFALPYCILNFTPMTTKQLLSLLMTGVSASCGQFAITAAYTYAPASELSVYDYTQVIFASILGFLFLGEIPDVLSIIGYVTIIAASIVMFLMRTRHVTED